MERRKNEAARLAWIGVALLCVAVLSTAAGLFDQLFPAGAADRKVAIASLLLYTAVPAAGLWLIPRALRRWRETLAAVASTVVALGIVEVGARVLVPRASMMTMTSGGTASAEFHHELPADTRMYHGVFEGQTVYVDTNEDGFRTPYSREEFQRHEHRIAVLGDSFAFGLGVTDADMFTTRLEEQLRRATGSDSVAVLNAGAVSYSPMLERLALEKKVAAYRPTLVLLLLDASDIGDDYRYGLEAVESEGRTSFVVERWPPNTYRGALFELTRAYHRPFWAVVRFPLQVGARVSGLELDVFEPYDYYSFNFMVGDTLETNRFFIFRHPLQTTRPFFDSTMRHIDAIEHQASQIGAPFALLVAPRFQHWNPKECPDNWEKDQYRLDEPYQNEYLRYFDESIRPYPIVNLLPDFKATNRFPLVFRNDPHWNATGNEFVAEVVTKHVMDRHLLRPDPGRVAGSIGGPPLDANVPQ